jgi:hypothetical protein
MLLGEAKARAKWALVRIERVRRTQATPESAHSLQTTSKSVLTVGCPILPLRRTEGLGVDPMNVVGKLTVVPLVDFDIFTSEGLPLGGFDLGFGVTIEDFSERMAKLDLGVWTLAFSEDQMKEIKDWSTCRIHRIHPSFPRGCNGHRFPAIVLAVRSLGGRQEEEDCPQSWYWAGFPAHSVAGLLQARSAESPGFQPCSEVPQQKLAGLDP